MDVKRADAIRESAAALYGKGQKVWDGNDRWNSYKHQQITRFIETFASHMLTASTLVLNAGSGGDLYSCLPKTTINVDLFIAQVSKLPNAVVCDISRLPFATGAFDFVLCVGPVLNYAPVFESLSELGRVIKAGGHLLLHYESSRSFEHIFRNSWNRFVAPIETINAGRRDKLWVYSPTLIKQLLKQNNLTIQKSATFHILSAVATRFGLSQSRAARLSSLDRLFAWLAEFADDRIILAEKTAVTKPATSVPKR